MESAYLEKLGEKIARWFKDNRIIFLAGLLSGLLSYGFAFTNKLVNLDDIHYLFSLGETFSSGRWGLGLLSAVFPSVSVPWIYGILSLLVLSAAACGIAELFGLNNSASGAVFAAVMLSFTVQTQFFAYMFTALPYAIAAALAVSAFACLCRGTKKGFVSSVIFLCLSLSIYQVEVALFLSLTLVYIIKLIYDGERDAKSIIRLGLLSLACAAASGVVYLLLNKLFMAVTGTKANDYMSDTMELTLQNIVMGIKSAYISFLYYFRYRLYGIVAADISMLVHAALLLLTGGVFAVKLFRCGDNIKRILLIVCVLLLPLAINCMFVVSKSRHALMAYAFLSIYLLAAVSAQSISAKPWLKKAVCILLALTAAGNIFYANSFSLKQKLEYEEAFSYYQTLASRLKSVPGYDENTEIVLCGEANEGVYTVHEIETGNIMAIGNNILNVYSRADFLKYYVGLTNPISEEPEKLSPEALTALVEMKTYPYDGSIRPVGDKILVKLG